MATKIVAGINGEILTIEDKGRRVFSKLKLYMKCKELGYWSSIKPWLEAEDLWDAFVLAQDVSEENALFSSGVKMFQEKLGLSDEKVEEILASCVVEGMS